MVASGLSGFTNSIRTRNLRTQDRLTNPDFGLSPHLSGPTAVRAVCFFWLLNTSFRASRLKKFFFSGFSFQSLNSGGRASETRTFEGGACLISATTFIQTRWDWHLPNLHESHVRAFVPRSCTQTCARFLSQPDKGGRVSARTARQCVVIQRWIVCVYCCFLGSQLCTQSATVWRVFAGSSHTMVSSTLGGPAVPCSLNLMPDPSGKKKKTEA